jgi:hypothetical protein
MEKSNLGSLAKKAAIYHLHCIFIQVALFKILNGYHVTLGQSLKFKKQIKI